MSSFLRAGASIAAAPLRLLHRRASAVASAVSEGGAGAAELVGRVTTFLRRDRSAAAAALVGVGPLLLDVLREAAALNCLRLFTALLADLLAILQLKEIRTIVWAVGQTARAQQLLA